MIQRRLQFLLVPDTGAARRVRRLVAEEGACLGVVVGSWPELIEWARHAYLLAVPSSNFEAQLDTALAGLGDAFWAESYRVVPDETGAAVLKALTEVVAATDSGGAAFVTGIERLELRPKKHLEDLLRLAEALKGRLPDELAMIRGVLDADPSGALSTLRVLAIEGWPRLTRWQRALIEKLNRDVGGAGAEPENEKGLLALLETARAGAVARGSLGVLQSRLYRAGEAQAPLDDTVQWVGVRDFLQEAEVAAGLVQSMLAAEPALKPADIGLLLPDSFEYAVAVEDAFRLGGLALSGLPVERWRRDLGREAVLHFLYCRQKPAPAMAYAVCLSSPLMPWDAATGAELAQTVMEGKYELEPPYKADAVARAMLDLLRTGDSEAATLFEALRSFGGLLAAPETLEGHLVQARATIEALCARVAGAQEIDWRVLRRLAIPKLVTSGEAPDFNREGVTVWRAGHEPWRPVKRLIVLGFAQGQYPASVGHDPVFVASDWAAIRERTGLPVSTPAEVVAERRERFRRQLGAVTDSVTFLVPRRNAAGEAQVASESLVFMHRLFDGPEAAEGLIAEVDSAEGRERVRWLRRAAAAVPRPPRGLVAEDLEFGRDLVALRRYKDGTPKPESPSSLETLMVSPFAWLLKRLEAKPLAWAPESSTPTLLGTIAHDVFKELFSPGAPLPTRAEIPARVEGLLEEALRRFAPFLRSAQWKVERRHLATQMVEAAGHWRDTLAALEARVLAPEEWIAGTWKKLAVHGQTDLILELPGGRVLVVDYKRSKSDKRLTQMQKGFDSQATLYREMLKTGGPKDPRHTEIAARIRAADQIGVVYYMLNDQVALSDTALPAANAVPGWRTLANDISVEAMARIEARLGEVRVGSLRLNRKDAAEFFEKQAGLKPYALETSPLIPLFSLPPDEEAVP